MYTINLHIYIYTQDSGTLYEAFFFHENSLLILSFTESTVNQCLGRVQYIYIHIHLYMYTFIVFFVYSM